MKNRSINHGFQFKSIGYLILMSLLISVGVVSASDEEDLQKNNLTTDGLTVVKSTRYTETEIKKDVDWSEYTKYQISPVEVSFRKNWKRDYNRNIRGVSGQVSDKDMTRIRESMAKIVHEELDSALKEKSGLTATGEVDSGTLLFKPRIINLDVYAPDIPTSSRSNSYIRQAGRATLFLEVYDAISGEILGRWVDTREDPDRGYLEWANRVTNTERARLIVKGWANRLVEGLDKLRSTN